MSDEWSDEIEAPRRRGGVPRWLLWTCGIGCGVALLATVVLVTGGVILFQRAKDPEIVTPKIQKYLPCDEWPEEYEPSGFVFFGYGYFSVEWPQGTMMLQPIGDRTALEQVFSGTNFAEKDRVISQVEIQGRSTRAMTFRQMGMDFQQMRVDISGDTGPCSLLVLPNAGGEELDLTRVEDFLAPFDVWRDED